MCSLGNLETLPDILFGGHWTYAVSTSPYQMEKGIKSGGIVFGLNKVIVRIQCRIKVDLKLTSAKKRDPDFTRFGRNAQEDALNRIFLVRPTKRSDNTNEELHGRFMVPWNARKKIFSTLDHVFHTYLIQIVLT